VPDTVTCPYCRNVAEPGDLDCSLCGQQLPVAPRAFSPPPVAFGPPAAAVPPPPSPALPGFGYPPPAQPWPGDAGAPPAAPGTAVPVGPPRGGGWIPVAALMLLVVVAAAVALLLWHRSNADQTAAPSPRPAGSTASSSTPDQATSQEATVVAPAQLQHRERNARITVPATSSPAPDAGNNQVTYDAAHLVDGDPATAWRMDGDGAGSSLRFDVDGPTTFHRIGLINGYTKIDPYDSTDRYPQMRRITQVTWNLDGRTFTQLLHDGNQSPQLIDVPDVTATSITLTIDATTGPGVAALDYTPISEVQLLGG